MTAHADGAEAKPDTPAEDGFPTQVGDAVEGVLNFMRSLLPERIYTTVLIAAWFVTSFTLFVIETKAFRPYAMTVGGAAVTTFLAVAIVFANRRTKGSGLFAPVDVNFLGLAIPVVLIARAMLLSTIDSGDFTASALDALLGSAMAGVGAGLMAFAKKDASD